MVLGKKRRRWRGTWGETARTDAGLYWKVVGRMNDDGDVKGKRKRKEDERQVREINR